MNSNVYIYTNMHGITKIMDSNAVIINTFYKGPD